MSKPLRLSLCCISDVLAQQGHKFQMMTFSRFSSLPKAEAVRALSERILNNFRVTERIIQHCHDSGIAGYRISSDLTPVINHPEVNLSLSDLPHWSEIVDALDSISKTIQRTGVRVSAHPSEYISLTSDKPEVFANSMRDLISHAEIFDLIGLPNNYESPLNIHCRQDGDPVAISQRFLANFAKLPSNVKSRLVLEVNDNLNGTWSVTKLHKYFYEVAGIPVTYDSLHRQFCNDGANDEQDFRLAHSTWPVTPIFHYSEGVDGTRKHADMPIGTPNDYDKDVYFDVELKGKDKAIFEIIRARNACVATK